MQSMQDAKISLGRLAEIHNKKSETEVHNMPSLLPQDKGISLVEDLCFRYGRESSPLVLDHVNINITEGKVTAIVGASASGSGKTKLMKLLLKFYTPSTGKIRIGNTNLLDVDTIAWRQNCGVVMQNGFIFDDSVLRNITESESAGLIDRERLKKAIEIANLEEIIESLPNGLTTEIGPNGISLSGGQNQRILIARAVYKDPDYLFFDEATSSLDAKNERQIMQKLEDFYDGRTVLVIAHRLSTVKNADQIIVLDQGKLVECGNHEQLAQAKGPYYQLVKNQLELGN
jgi:ATP-binding cassette subfamily B protein